MWGFLGPIPGTAPVSFCHILLDFKATQIQRWIKNPTDSWKSKGLTMRKHQLRKNRIIEAILSLINQVDIFVISTEIALFLKVMVASMSLSMSKTQGAQSRELWRRIGKSLRMDRSIRRCYFCYDMFVPNTNKELLLRAQDFPQRKIKDFGIGRDLLERCQFVSPIRISDSNGEWNIVTIRSVHTYIYMQNPLVTEKESSYCRHSGKWLYFITGRENFGQLLQTVLATLELYPFGQVLQHLQLFFYFSFLVFLIMSR